MIKITDGFLAFYAVLTLCNCYSLQTRCQHPHKPYPNSCLYAGLLKTVTKNALPQEFNQFTHRKHQQSNQTARTNCMSSILCKVNETTVLCLVKTNSCSQKQLPDICTTDLSIQVPILLILKPDGKHSLPHYFNYYQVVFG